MVEPAEACYAVGDWVGGWLLGGPALPHQAVGMGPGKGAGLLGSLLHLVPVAQEGQGLPQHVWEQDLRVDTKCQPLISMGSACSQLFPAPSQIHRG